MLSSKTNFKVIGFDPGYAINGYGVIERREGYTTCLDYGCIFSPKEMPMEKRLFHLSLEVDKILKKYKPEAVAVELLMFQKNVKTAIAVGQARGVIMAAVGKCGAKLIELTPTAIKQALTNYGHAEKKQVQYMVKQVLKLKETPEPDDAADALAVALAAEQNYINNF